MHRKVLPYPFQNPIAFVANLLCPHSKVAKSAVQSINNSVGCINDTVVYINIGAVCIINTVVYSLESVIGKFAPRLSEVWTGIYGSLHRALPTSEKCFAGVRILPKRRSGSASR